MRIFKGQTDLELQFDLSVYGEDLNTASFVISALKPSGDIVELTGHSLDGNILKWWPQNSSILNQIGEWVIDIEIINNGRSLLTDPIGLTVEKRFTLKKKV